MATDAGDPDLDHLVVAEVDGAGDAYNWQNLAGYELEDDDKDDGVAG
jgi:hypothetical protein